MTENKENVNEKVKDHLNRPSTNIWGWKWSWISLVIIILGFLFLVFVKPKQVTPEELTPFETENIDSIK